MKHPLTSKERRGVVAVAAAALLCIGAGFVFRSCRPLRSEAAAVTVIDNDSVSFRNIDEKKEEPRTGKRSRRAARKASPKTYPVRSPLDEPCDR